MVDREKVINELVEHIESALAIDSDYVDCVRTDLLQYTVALLKEQEWQIKNRDESIEKAQEEIKWLRGMLKEQVREQIVHCKDCKYGLYTGTEYHCDNHSGHENRLGEDQYYKEWHNGNWFCADGQRR